MILFFKILSSKEEGKYRGYFGNNQKGNECRNHECQLILKVIQ